jgi:hypothetical protein
MLSERGRELAVVVRYTKYESDDPEHRVALIAAYQSPDQADSEAARLNSVARDPERVSYFVKIVRLLPAGEDPRLAAE